MSLQLDILRDAIGTDILNIIINLSKDSYGYIEIKPLFEFILSYKGWWGSLLPFLKKVALRQKEIVNLSSLMLIETLNFTTIYIQKDSSLAIESFTVPVLRNGKLLYSCVFKTLFEHQRHGKITFSSLWSFDHLKYVPHTNRNTNYEAKINKRIQKGKERKKFIIAAIHCISLLETSKVVKKNPRESIYAQQCSINPGSIFKWMESMWTGSSNSDFLNDLRKEIDIGTSGNESWKTNSELPVTKGWFTDAGFVTKKSGMNPGLAVIVRNTINKATVSTVYLTLSVMIYT